MTSAELELELQRAHQVEKLRAVVHDRALRIVENLLRERGITRIELLDDHVTCHRQDADDDWDSRSRGTLADAVLVFPAFPEAI